MTKLLITRGLPASGKSTYARKWVLEDPTHRAEVNRDHLREMMHGGYANAEVSVTVAGHAAIRELLHQGVDVVCSDTNLPQRNARELASLARRAGADVEVIDLTNVPLETCLARNVVRIDKDPVPERVIRDMHRRYIASKQYPLPSPVEDEYHGVANFAEFDPSLAYAVLVDIDGTVALKGARSPFDESRVHEDRPNLPVIETLFALYEYLLQSAGPGETPKVVFMSGRTDACKEATIDWLRYHTGLPFELHMRASGDRRKDSIVKRELFDQHIRGKYNVLCVLDDRDQVVKMWREELGLTCLQVAEGNF
jgi:predicted kinase